ncbi:MAG: hypothetical protein VCA18_11545 [Opitutales bacterium]
MGCLGRNWIARRLGYAGLVGLAVLSGCVTNHYDRTEEFQFSWKVGDVQGAAEQASELAKKGPKRDRLLYLLEEGSARRAAGDAVGSRLAFSAAEENYKRWFGAHHKTPFRLSEQFASVVGSAEWKPYKTRIYERVMMWLYQALNYMEIGDAGRTRAEIFKTRQAISDAKLLWKEELEEAREQMKKKGIDLDKTVGDPRAKSKSDQILAEARSMVPANLPDYVNPAALFLEALYFLRTGSAASDFEKAEFSLRELLVIHPDNPWLKEDFRQAARKLVDPEPTTYLFLETGRAARRSEFRLEYPLSVTEVLPPQVALLLMDPTSRIPYLGVALPRLRANPSHLEGLQVEADGMANVRTLPLADLDAIIAKEFDKTYPVELAKAIAGALTKAGIQHAVTDSVREKDETTRVATGIGIGMLAHVTTKADLRAWSTLPKKVLFCKFPTPAKKRLTLRGVGRNLVAEVELPEGQTNVVWVRSVTPATPLRIVANFTLEPDL